MFEIGSALREARERRGLSYAQVEDETKIRARYIRALEEEAFGVLPGTTYSKGFLRAYADYLGLDGHLFIDEFNSRYHDPRGEEEKPIYPPSRRRLTRDRRETNVVVIVLAAIVAIASLVFIAAWSNGPAANVPIPPPSSPSTGASTGATSGGQTSTKQHQKQHTKQQAKPARYKVTIAAENGDSWVSAHIGASDGPAATTVRGTDLSQYLLHQGEVAELMTRAPVYLQLGAPGSVVITVAGKTVELPAGTSFKITRQQISQA
jgi:cytoskeletal protein RodZ